MTWLHESNSESFANDGAAVLKGALREKDTPIAFRMTDERSCRYT
jgi:hypothetical protein